MLAAILRRYFLDMRTNTNGNTVTVANNLSDTYYYIAMSCARHINFEIMRECSSAFFQMALNVNKKS